MKKHIAAAAFLTCALAGCHPTTVVPVQPMAPVGMQAAPMIAQPGYTYVWDSTSGGWQYIPTIVYQRNTVRYRTVSPTGQSWTTYSSSPGYRPVMMNPSAGNFGANTSRQLPGSSGFGTRPAGSSAGSFGTRTVAPPPGGSFSTTRSTSSFSSTTQQGFGGNSGSFGSSRPGGSFSSSTTTTTTRPSGSFGSSTTTTRSTTSSFRSSGSFGKR